MCEYLKSPICSVYLQKLKLEFLLIVLVLKDTKFLSVTTKRVNLLRNNSPLYGFFPGSAYYILIAILLILYNLCSDFKGNAIIESQSESRKPTNVYVTILNNIFPCYYI